MRVKGLGNDTKGREYEGSAAEGQSDRETQQQQNTNGSKECEWDELNHRLPREQDGARW